MLNYVNSSVRPRLLALVMLLVSSMWLAPAKAAETADSFVIGTGFVIGLAGTGDSAVDETLVERSIVGVLRQAGMDPWRGEIVPGRIARVIVTAELPPNAAPGTPLTFTVTAVGDAASLAGGTLLPTPLRLTNGTVYRIGEGQVAVVDRVATVAKRQEGSPTGERTVAIVTGTITFGGHAQELAAD